MVPFGFLASAELVEDEGEEDVVLPVIVEFLWEVGRILLEETLNIREESDTCVEQTFYWDADEDFICFEELSRDESIIRKTISCFELGHCQIFYDYALAIEIFDVVG